MEVKFIEPIGECFWVKNAVKKAQEIVAQNAQNRVYIFGSLIHNERALNEIVKKNVKVVNFSKNYAELEYFFEKENIFYSEDVLILSAHGHTLEHEKVFRRYFKNIIDLTCPKIKKQNDFASENNDKNIIFIGHKNHEETLNITEFGKDIFVYDLKEKFDYSKLDLKKKTVAISQSTLSSFDIENALEDLKKNIPDLIDQTGICSEVSVRQQLAKDAAQIYDIIFVLGSYKSSNTMRLLEIIKEENHAKAYLIEDLYDLKAHQIKENEKVAIMSGTSAPESLINEVKDYFNNK